FHIRTPSPKNNSSPTRRPCSAYYKVGGTILDACTHPFSLDNSQKKSLHLRGSAVKSLMGVSAFPVEGPFIFALPLPRTIRRRKRRRDFVNRRAAEKKSFLGIIKIAGHLRSDSRTCPDFFLARRAGSP